MVNSFSAADFFAHLISLLTVPSMQGILGFALHSHNDTVLRIPAPSRVTLSLKHWWAVRRDPMQAFREMFNLEEEPQDKSIPHIIHQSWRTRRVEPFQQKWQKTWLENHPTWTYMFWTDKDNRDLIADKFPWFLSIYDSLPNAIQRADCARYFYMLQYGGCYFDLDFVSLKPLDPLLKNVQVALAYMTKDIPHELSLPNAFMASVPGHKFWHYVIKHVLRNYEGGKVDVGDAHRVTGPIMLKEAVADYQSTSINKALTVFPAETMYGVDWNWRGDPSMHHIFSVCHAPDPKFNSTQCKTFFPDAYAITYWSGDITWGK